MIVPVKWIVGVLIFVAVSGISLGVLSFVSPKHSIQLYQWIMKMFNWRVEPIDQKRELRNTKWLGVLMTVLSVLILVVLVRSKVLQLVW